MVSFFTLFSLLPACSKGRMNKGVTKRQLKRTQEDLGKIATNLHCELTKGGGMNNVKLPK